MPISGPPTSVNSGSCWAQQAVGSEVVDSNSPQSQKDRLETVTRKRVSFADGEESIKAILTEARERIQADLRLYEKEPGNYEGKKLRILKVTELRT